MQQASRISATEAIKGKMLRDDDDFWFLYSHIHTHCEWELHPQKQVYFVNEVGVWINMGNIIEHNS